MPSSRIENRVSDLLADAREARDAGDWKTARSLLDAVSALDPGNAEAAAMLAGAATRRQMTLLFCDIVGSTELADQRDPEEVTAIIERYRTRLRGGRRRAGRLHRRPPGRRHAGAVRLSAGGRGRRSPRCAVRSADDRTGAGDPSARSDRRPAAGAHLGAHRPGGRRRRHHRFDRQRGRPHPAARRPGHRGDQRHHPGPGVAVVRDRVPGNPAPARGVATDGGVRRPRRAADSTGPDLAGPDQPVRQPYGGVLGHGVAGAEADRGDRHRRL